MVQNKAHILSWIPQVHSVELNCAEYEHMNYHRFCHLWKVPQCFITVGLWKKRFKVKKMHRSIFRQTDPWIRILYLCYHRTPLISLKLKLIPCSSSTLPSYYSIPHHIGYFCLSEFLHSQTIGSDNAWVSTQSKRQWVSKAVGFVI